MQSVTKQDAVDSAIEMAMRERSSIHPIVSVERATTLAMQQCHAGQAERLEISRLVCERSLNRRLVLVFEGD